MTVSRLDRYRTDGLTLQSPQRLVVLLYQRLGADLQRAEASLRAAERGHAHDQLVHAQDIVTELRLALNTEAWPGGPGLDELYRYLERRLVEANTTKSVEVVAECRAIVDPLIEAWEAAYRTVQCDRGELYGRTLA